MPSQLSDSGIGVFISYSHEDRFAAETLADRLRSVGFDPWIDFTGLVGGTRWQQEIHDALKQAAAVIVVITPQAMDSEWVKYEIEQALEEGVPLIPVMISTSEPIEPLKPIQYIDFRGGYSAFDQLHRALLFAVAEHFRESDKPTEEESDEIVKAASNEEIHIHIAGDVDGTLMVAGDDASSITERMERPRRFERRQRDDGEDDAVLPADIPARVLGRLEAMGIHPAVAGGVVGGLVLLVFIGLALGGVFGGGGTVTPTPPDTDVTLPPDADATDTPEDGEPTATLDQGRTQLEASDNRSWEAVEREFAGVPMVLVPTGCFLMGDRNGFSDESPVAEMCIDEPFWLDKYEVTLGALEVGDTEDADLPAQGITWFSARSFCGTRGGRLPTEAEWEFAASGPSNFTYPWGNSQAQNGNFNGTERDPVGQHPDGVSWVGAHDMAGNLFEWTLSKYKPYPYDPGDGREAVGGDEQRVYRGGSYASGYDQVRTAYRGNRDPGYASGGVGFRCARDFFESDLQ